MNRKIPLYFEEQAYSEAADMLYSRAGDCDNETMSNAYIKIAERLDKKSHSIYKRLRSKNRDDNEIHTKKDL
jgi:hypothetical protein